MTGGALLLLMLLVSWSSLLLQGAVLAYQLRQQATYRAEQLAANGHVRTAACRVLAAAVYVAVSVLDAAGVQVPGAGGLSPEALVVFSGVQLIWLSNSALDIRLRRQLKKPGGGAAGAAG